ncbi:MAG: UDP-N-acetylmuramoyl-L-alanine--D-glutamate ligase [Chthonomonas sp.]|nr:UDP-N-acetylmuramoyl-L-alanine--D-glutamate ligase [Chthonomonas sp.]
MKDLRIAVAGMGRSGLAIARAARAHGAVPVVYDEQSADTPERLDLVDQLQGEGIDCVCGWHGRFDAGEHDILVASPGFRRAHPAIVDAQRLGMEVISEIEFAYRIAKGPILAITGTNGKSTSTVMTWLVLRALGHDPILCGNISGSGYTELTLTEAALAGSAGQPLVAEISSFQLEWVSQFRPRVATITNITPDHLDRHPTFKDYFATKMRLFDAMGEGDTMVIRSDEPSLPMSVFGNDKAARLLYGPGHEISFDADGLTIKGHRVAASTLPFDEPYNLANAAMALAIAEAYAPGSDVPTAVRGLQEFSRLTYRMQPLGERDGVLVINNSMCTNPMAVVNSSRGLNRPQILLIGGVTKNLDFHPVGEYVRESGHRAILFGPNPDPLRAMIGGDLPWFESMTEAFRFAVTSASAGDAIVLAPGCASAYPYANFRERGDAFTEVAKEWLEHRD